MYKQASKQTNASVKAFEDSHHMQVLSAREQGGDIDHTLTVITFWTAI